VAKALQQWTTSFHRQQFYDCLLKPLNSLPQINSELRLHPNTVSGWIGQTVARCNGIFLA